MSSSISLACGIEKPTVIDIVSDQRNIFRSVFRTLSNKYDEAYYKIVIGLKPLNVFAKNSYLICFTK